MRQGFLLSQNDGDEVVWHSSPLSARPALPALEDSSEPHDGSGYARGGPAGFSGRSSPLPAVKSMLSTASMLKQCGKTTSPPDAKVSCSEGAPFHAMTGYWGAVPALMLVVKCIRVLPGERSTPPGADCTPVRAAHEQCPGALAAPEGEPTGEPFALASYPSGCQSAGPPPLLASWQ